MANPASIQLYLNSSTAIVADSVKRGNMYVNLYDAIDVPEGYEAHVMLVDAQIPNTWAVLQKFLLVKTSFSYRNQYGANRYFAKIPVNVAQNFYINYINQTMYSHPIRDRTLSYIQVSIHNEDGSDVSLGSGWDWSCTLQVDFKKVVAIEKKND